MASPHRTPRAGTVEQRQKAVARGSDLTSTEVRDLTAHQRVMPPQQIAPCPVAQARRLLGRTDDVGEQHRRQDAIVLQCFVLAGDEPLHGCEDAVDVAR
jgi:hypothetical protein